MNSWQKEHPSGVMAKTLDFALEVSKFEIQSPYNI